MATVEKGNVVLTVKDDETERYLELGYNVVDDSGNVIRECVPADVGALRVAYTAHRMEIKALKKQIEALKAQIGSNLPADNTENEQSSEKSEGKEKAKSSRKTKDTNEE